MRVPDWFKDIETDNKLPFIMFSVGYLFFFALCIWEFFQ